MALSQKRIIVRNIFSNYVALGIQMVVRVIQLGLFARALGDEGLGLFVLFLAMPTIAQITGYSISKSTVRYMSVGLAKNDLHIYNSYFNSSFLSFSLLAALSSIVIIALYPFLAQIINIPSGMLHEANISLIVVAIGVFVTFPFNGVQGACYAAQRYDLVSIVRSVILLIQLGLFWSFYKFGLLTVSSALILIFVTRLFERLAWALVAFKNFPGLKINPSLITKSAIISIFSFSAVAVIIDVANIFAYEGFKFLVGNQLTLTEVGAYGVFAMLAGSITSISWMASSVVMPVAGKLGEQNEPEKLDKLFYYSTKITMVLGIGFCIVIIPFLPVILKLWAGASIAGYWGVCAILLAGQVTRFMAIGGVNMLAGLGKQKVQAILTVFWVTLGLSSSYIVLRFWSQTLFWPVVTMSIARLIGGLSMGAYAAHMLLIRPQTKYWINAGVKPLIGAIVTATCGFALIKYIPDFIPYSGIIISVLISLLVYSLWSFLLTFSKKERSELFSK